MGNADLPPRGDVPRRPAHADVPARPVSPARPAAPAQPVAPTQPAAAQPPAQAQPAATSPGYRTVAVDPTTGQYLGPVVLPPSGIPAIRREKVRIELVDIDKLLTDLVTSGGSDLHMSVGTTPMFRINGLMTAVPNQPSLKDTSVEDSIFPILTPDQKERFLETNELDFAYTVGGVARFRGNILRSTGHTAAVFRVIPWEIKNLEKLGMPKVLENLAMLPRGLVLVTGPTGSGKSTTLAAMVDYANRNRQGHIVTIEDPIEFVHQHRGCVVNQREIGADTKSFSQALKHVLRQDPDIILIGEMRDLETIQAAITAAETGHLVFGTLHTQSAQSTINRIIDVFPTDQQEQVRAQLSQTLKAVVAQTLVRTIDGRGRVAATEIMVLSPAIASMIRRGEEYQIPQAIQAGVDQGMHTLNQDLARLINEKRITPKSAEEVSPDKRELATLSAEVGGSATAAATLGGGLDFGLNPSAREARNG